MSLASSIVGVPGLEVERVHRRNGIEIWAKPLHRPSCLYCGADQLRIKSTEKRTVKHSRQGNRVMTLHLKVFDVKQGRSESSLRSYLSGLKDRDKVQVMVMDLSETYRSIAKKYFPNATIVADRFHVVRLINHHFLNQWKLHDEDGRRNRGLISLMRRHEWKLSDEQRVNLMNYLSDYPALKALYRAKQKLIRYVLLKTLTAKRTKRKLPGFL